MTTQMDTSATVAVPGPLESSAQQPVVVGQSAISSVAASPRGIMFRPEGDGFATQAMNALLVLVLLLAACLALAWYARKRGWLMRWTVAAAQPGAPARKAMRVEQFLRLSPKTRMYRVSDSGRQYLVIESSVHAQLISTEVADGTDA